MDKLIAFCKWRQELPFEELAKKLKQLGFDGVDLPCRPNAPVTHANGPEKLPEAKRILAEQGLSLERLVTSLQDADDECERLLAAISELGIRKIRIAGCSVAQGGNAREKLDETRRRLSALQKLLEKHGVSGGIQNHSGPALEVNVSSTLRMVEDCDPQWVGVQYDPGHATISGEPIRLALDLLGPYLHSVNLKSPRQEYFIDPESGRLAYQPVWVPLRDGMLDLPGLLQQLKRSGYSEALSIHGEYRSYFYRIEEDPEAVDELIAADVRYARSLLQDL